MRHLPLFALSLLAAALPITGASAESSTIRIEPRPYYGAVVTLEQGVRVWRPLPPTRHMIINPTGAPVHVNVADIRETITHNGGAASGALHGANGYGSNGYAGAPAYYYGRPGFGLRHRGPVHRSRSVGGRR